MIAAAASTIFAMGVSKSPQIHLPITRVLGSQPQSTTSASAAIGVSASAQGPSSGTNQHINKRFVLIQHDFGWNGTFGGPTLRVNKGDVVQITVINAGTMAHNFGIAALSKETLNLLQKTTNMALPDRIRYLPYNTMAIIPCPGCQQKFQEGAIDQFMQPDTQQVTTFTANEAGHFNYFCQVRGHLWLGMVGDLDVVNGTNATSQVTRAGGTI
jgi:FtsP/CotA-like multicopper oxidase with cupredoxin domain